MVAEQMSAFTVKAQKEKAELEGFLQSKIEKNLKLELQLDEIKDAYRALESTMSTGDKTFKQKFEQLEGTIEQITVMYQTAVNERNILKTDLQLEKRQRQKIEERAKQIIKKYDSQRKKNETLEKILKDLRDGYILMKEQQDKEEQAGVLRGSALRSSKVAIRGGGGTRTGRTPKSLKGKGADLDQQQKSITGGTRATVPRQ